MDELKQSEIRAMNIKARLIGKRDKKVDNLALLESRRARMLSLIKKNHVGSHWDWLSHGFCSWFINSIHRPYQLWLPRFGYYPQLIVIDLLPKRRDLLDQNPEIQVQLSVEYSRLIHEQVVHLQTHFCQWSRKIYTIHPTNAEILIVQDLSVGTNWFFNSDKMFDAT